MEFFMRKFNHLLYTFRNNLAQISWNVNIVLLSPETTFIVIPVSTAITVILLEGKY